MARPTIYTEPRVGTNIRLRPELHAAFRAAADERGVSFNWLAERALADYLERLLPVDEIRWTRERSAEP